MVTMAQFSRNIRSLNSQLDNSATKVVKATASRALRSLVNNTPVDKGVARSNWRVGIGAPTRAVIQAYAPGNKLGIGERANASAAIGAGLARIKTVRGKSGVGLQTAIYISNAVPYIGLLNNGQHSKQAPAGFIQTALLEASLEVHGFKLRL